MSKYDLTLRQGKIGPDGLAIQEGWIKTYLTHPVTREYSGASMEYVMTGGSLPAGMYPDAPALPEEDHQAIRRSEDGSHWEIVPDYRGHTAWHTDTREPVLIELPGELPENLTLQKTATAFDVWREDKWVTDETAQHERAILEAEQYRDKLIEDALQQTQLWQSQLLLNMISDEDKQALTEWMNYIQALRDTDMTLAPDIDWPHKPAQ